MTSRLETWPFDEQLKHFGISDSQFDIALDKCYDTFIEEVRKRDMDLTPSDESNAFYMIMYRDYGLYFKLFEELYIDDEEKFLKFKLEWC